MWSRQPHKQWTQRSCHEQPQEPQDSVGQPQSALAKLVPSSTDLLISAEVVVAAGVAGTAGLSQLAEAGWTTASDEDPLKGEGA